LASGGVTPLTMKKFTMSPRLGYTLEVIDRGGRMGDDAEPQPLWDDVAFRRRVSELAAVRGLNLEQVSELAGLSPTYFYKRAHRHGRSIEGLLHIAQVLHVDVRDLIFIRSQESSAGGTTTPAQTCDPNQCKTPAPPNNH
jgi:hypothetical protein